LIRIQRLAVRTLVEVKLQFVVKIDRSLARHEEAQVSQEFSQHADTS
jgi:hypothetical protein